MFRKHRIPEPQHLCDFDQAELARMVAGVLSIPAVPERMHAGYVATGDTAYAVITGLQPLMTPLHEFVTLIHPVAVITTRACECDCSDRPAVMLAGAGAPEETWRHAVVWVITLDEGSDEFTMTAETCCPCWGMWAESVTNFIGHWAST